MTGPCDGLRLIDFSRSYPGALATMVLADAGVEVVKVEPSSGDPTRLHYASAMWHRGKKSVVLDLKTPDGLADARRLAATADVALVTGRPGIADRLGIGYEALRRGHPGLVYCEISGFGPRGPLANVKGYEAVVQAVSGRMNCFHGMAPKDGPIYAAEALGCYGAAMLAIHGILAALHVRSQTGRGQKVETSLLQAMTVYDISLFTGWQMARRAGEKPAMGYQGGPIPPYMTARTRDGHWVQFGNLTVNTQWNFLNALGLTEMLKDPRYQTMPNYPSPPDQLAAQQLFLQRILEKDRDEWMRIFMEADVAAEPFRTTQEGLSHEQAVHNGDVIELQDPVLGPVRQLGPLARFSETPMRPSAPAPRLGEHTAQILGSFAPRHQTGRTRPMPKHPLSGVTVLEFASFIAAPLATSLLADLGARVIKVEPVTGDLFRTISFPKNAATLQGKEGLAMDLKDPRAQEAIHRLAAKADVLVHNFRPGVPERLGIDYARLSAVNPRLIYLYAGAYGSSGPHSHRTGFHPIAGAITGGPRLQLGKALPPPPDQPLTLEEVRAVSDSMRRSNESNPDPVSALANAASVLMALHARDRTGRGQYIETTMLCSNLHAHAKDALSYPGKPPRMETDVGYNGLHALYRLYETREGWVFLACLTDPDWRALCEAMGVRHLLGDKRFGNVADRLKHEAEIAAALEPAFPGRTATEWQEILTRAGIACVRVFHGEVGEFLDTTPWVKELGYVAETEHPSLGRYWRHAPPYVFSDQPGRPGPNMYLGEHTRRILAELGYSPEAVRAMEADGVALSWDAGKAAVKSG